MLGVSFDSVEENKAFAEKFNFNFDLLSDADRKMGLAYGACSSAQATGATRIGVIIDPEGNVLEFDTKANVKTFPVEALARLQD